MCGIAGELRRDGAADVDALRRMQATLTDRGPDGEGLWAQAGAGLAHRRLSIIDLSVRGAQPMVDQALGLVAVFNGIIYNHRELRDELRAAGHTFASQADTEVILKGYAQWGEDVVEHLLGMFAFCIVEHESGRAFLARDRLGVKPLYLADAGGALRFASTLPALLAGGGVDTSLDPVALHHYLSFHSVVPAPRTLLAGVRKLPPATTLTVEPDGSRRERRYWRASFARDPAKADWGREEWTDAVREALRLAVARRMVSDVPVGVLLSGGLDSSLIVALLAESDQRGLATFSVGFGDVAGREGNEFAYSRMVADRFGTAHQTLEVTEDRLMTALDDAIGAMSEPMVSHDCVAFYLLAQEVARHCKVVQSGQGADEVFGGYYWYPPLAEPGAGAHTYHAAFVDRPHAEMAEVLVEPLSDDVSGAFVEEHFAGAATVVDGALRIDSEVMLVEDPVKRVDNMTMAHGLEARTPFLDHELVELAGQCPPELKLAEGGKGIVKAAARGLLPDAVIDREKGFFPVPALSHLEGAVLELAREALERSAIIRPQYAAKLLADPNGQRTKLDGSKLWQLALLELWLAKRGLA
ncbi:MAG: N-acetylglutaminylglutamine amidotransferase [Solirubrobacteraceae bacterium]